MHWLCYITKLWLRSKFGNRSICLETDGCKSLDFWPRHASYRRLCAGQRCFFEPCSSYALPESLQGKFLLQPPDFFINSTLALSRSHRYPSPNISRHHLVLKERSSSWFKSKLVYHFVTPCFLLILPAWSPKLWRLPAGTRRSNQPRFSFQKDEECWLGPRW